MKRLLFFTAILSITGHIQAAVNDGYVVRTDSRTVYLDWGKSTSLQAGDRFLVYRPGAELKHPVSGEILGRSEDSLGTGVIEKIDEKYSTGRLLDTGSPIQSGDRTRWLEGAPPVSAIAPAVPLLDKEKPADKSDFPNLPEAWRSEAIKGVAMGLTLADVDGDGHKELFVAYKDRIEGYRIKDSKLESIVTYKEKKWGSWAGIEAADLTGKGRDELFATAYQNALNRGRVVVLRWEEGGLKRVGDLEGFARMVPKGASVKALLWQNSARSRDVRFTAPAPIEMRDGLYKAGKSIKIDRLREEQLFGFGWGDWDGDLSEDVALLQNDRLRVYNKDAKWTSDDIYGGTKNDVAFDEENLASFEPRFVVLSKSGERDVLVASHNISELGLRFKHLKMYKRAEITALRWNGMEMAPLWRRQVSGYLADFQLGHLEKDATDQLWTAAWAPGDKSVITAYSLP